MEGISDKAVNDLAAAASIPPAAVRRLLGAIKVAGGGAAPLDLGLRLSAELFASRAEGCAAAAAAIGRYAAACPQVFAWIVRGDFNAQRVPDGVDHAKLLHACRTAGRLRAGLYRK